MSSHKNRNLKLTLLSIVVVLLPGCGALDFSGSDSNASASASKSLEYNEEIMNGKLAPPKGISNKRLFNEELEAKERFNRLENIVQSLHDTLNKHLPSIENLTKIESEIEQLVGQLQTLVGSPEPMPAMSPQDVVAQPLKSNQPESAPIESTPAPKNAPVAQKPPTPVAPAPQPISTPQPVSQNPGGNMISNIRVSQDAQRTRIVFDSKSKINYKLDHDTAENIILLTADNANVSVDTASLARKSNKIDDFQLQTLNGNKTFIISLKSAANVDKGVLLPPNKDSQYYRYFFDIK